MKKLYFESSEDFEKFFSKRSKDYTDLIVEQIEKSMLENKKHAFICQIVFSTEKTAFEISIPAPEFVVALESCLDFYHENENADEAIECWKLLECAKVY